MTDTPSSDEGTGPRPDDARADPGSSREGARAAPGPVEPEPEPEPGRADSEPGRANSEPGPGAVGERSFFLRIWWYARLRMPRPLELLALTAMYGAGVTAGAISTELMLADRQIAAFAPLPIWNKLVTSYVGFILYFLHLRALLDACDAARAQRRVALRDPARGTLSPGDLTLLALLLLGIEVVLLANVGQIRLQAWGAAVAFSFAMRYDFGMRSVFGVRPFARTIAYAMTYPLVLAMLVAVAWESTITLGQFPTPPVRLLRPGSDGHDILPALPGLDALDLFIAQPLAFGSLYLAGLLVALAGQLAASARQHSHRPRLLRSLLAGLPAAGALAAAWTAFLLFGSTTAAIEVVVAIVLAGGAVLVLRRRTAGAEWDERRLHRLVLLAATATWLPLAIEGVRQLGWAAA